MKISKLLPIKIRCYGTLALFFCCLGRLSTMGQTVYTFNLDTTSLSGQSGTLAFDLTGGDALIGNNTVSVSGFQTDGTLGGGNFSFPDVNFFNEILSPITFGSYLRFDLGLTSDNAPPGVDEVSFFVLDGTASTSLFPTSDPLGGDALFVVDIDGSPSGAPSVYTSPAVEWTFAQQVSVPEGGNASMVIGIAVFGLIFFRGNRMRKSNGPAS